MVDEKYDKARRQGWKRFGILAVILLATFAAAVVWDNSSSNREALSIPVLKVPPAEAPKLTRSLLKEVEQLDAEVRRIKSTGVIMETDRESLAATSKLQEATRRLLAARYGLKEPYRVELALKFQDTIPDYKENGPSGTIILEMAPSHWQPHSVFTFLEMARQWKGGAFHRNAPHVLQVMSYKHFHPLAFQEYSKEYPHEMGTVGYAGRPSGPSWYISIQDNTENHGPGSQQEKNPHEADSCFGRVIEGFDKEVQRIKTMPGKEFIDDEKKHVLIEKMKIMVPGSDGYVEWKEKPLEN